MGRIAIKPEREYLREITAKLKEGSYAIPAFQRDFVWRKNQVMELFDSISKGYPIGSIILWRPTKDEVPMVKDAITEEIRDGNGTEYFILDGRQRTTAFFGCIYDWKEKPEIFQLYYNPEDDVFAYRSKRNEKGLLFPVSEVFDTFKMLGILQKIQQEIPDADTARRYIEKIKETNTILQQYEIGEMIIDNCTLEESSTVFSRINSKGTDISKVAMLQAMTYRDKGSVLLADSINRLISSLSRYGFGNMKSDDVLNCCYRYIGKNFYDNKVMESLVKADLKTIMPQLERDVTKAVNFLYEHCGVINYRLLPYTRQLTALAAFFMEKDNPTAEELREMERWFFYTTYQQTFLNGSLGNVRTVFRRFDEYLCGMADTAFDYKKIEIDNHLDFVFSPSSAQSNFIALCQVLQRRQADSETALEYAGEYRFLGKKPANSFLLLTSYDRDVVKRTLEDSAVPNKMDDYLLDRQMLDALYKQDISLFLHYRKHAIIEMTKRKLEDLGLEYEEYSHDGRDGEDGNIIGLLSEFSDLNNPERLELCDVLNNHWQCPSAVYDVRPSDDGNSFSINYNSFDHPYWLTDTSAARLLRQISERYCNGEDPIMYYSWLIASDD